MESAISNIHLISDIPLPSIYILVSFYKTNKVVIITQVKQQSFDDHFEALPCGLFPFLPKLATFLALRIITNFLYDFYHPHMPLQSQQFSVGLFKQKLFLPFKSFIICSFSLQNLFFFTSDLLNNLGCLVYSVLMLQLNIFFYIFSKFAVSTSI